jgi:tetratricopeptide (TPR) repeat protein
LVLATKGALNEAVGAFHMATVSDPNFAWANHNLGVALEDKGELNEAIREYRKAIRTASASDPRIAWIHWTLGEALEKNVEWDEAIREYREAIRLDLRLGQAHQSLCNALRRQGRFIEARDSILLLLTVLPEGAPLRPLALQQLQDCERLLTLEQKLLVILEGRDKPADNAERLTLARMCLEYKKLPFAAQRFSREAFDADVKLADDLQQQYRNRAARAAALAAYGQGRDAKNMEDKESARLRQQALDWLKADLVLWTKQAESANPQDRTMVQQQMRHWQTDADFTGVRDKDALAKLTAEERAAWQQFWAEVEAMLRKTGNKSK